MSRLGLLAGAALLLGCGGGGGAADGAGGVVGDGEADVAGDSDSAGDDGTPADSTPETGPDPAFVHAIHNAAVVSATESYVIDEARPLREAAGLFGQGITALATPGGRAWVGTAAGLHRLREDGGFELLDDPAAQAPVLVIGARLDNGGRVVAATSKHVLRVAPGLVRRTPGSGAVDAIALPDGGPAVTGLAVSPGGSVFVSTSVGAFIVGDTQLIPLEGPPGGFDGPILDFEAGPGARFWWVSPVGLWSWSPEEGGEATNHHVGAVSDVALGYGPGDLSAVAWAGTSSGLLRVEGGAVEAYAAEPGGLPMDAVLDVAVRGDRVVLGHSVGATVLRMDEAGALLEVQHSTGLRALSAPQVERVGLDADGAVWLGGAAGLSRVEQVERTLADKAQVMETLLDEHFWRLGFVAPDARLDDAWNPTTWSRSDSDNDGLWTQMQIGAWCYAYAATGDEAFRLKARRAMEQMFLLMDIPAVDFEAAGLGRGFISRSVVREDEGAVWEDKAGRDNWHLVRWEGQDWRWKDDTSSDETTGHFFGFPLYYDLCAADEAERAEVGRYAGELARAILRADYRLLDLDGEPTSHGHWEPDLLSAAVDGIDVCEAPFETCLDAFGGGGWLNSLEILGHMLAAWHMTGDVAFLEAYLDLIDTWRLDEVAMPHDLTATITIPSIMNHSDHELAMLAYHTLIRYEPDDARRQRWIESLLFLYEHEKIERNPLWAGFVAVLAGGEHAALDEALRSLREMPDDRRQLAIDNSHRKDSGPWPADRFDQPQWEAVFPYDEIGAAWWNANLHAKGFGGDGRSVRGPMAWLLPYWLLRYAGIIGE